MRRLIDHKTKFIAQVMGGSASYSDEQLERVHSHLDITGAAFMETLELLRKTLKNYNFTDDDIRHIEGKMMARKNFVSAKRWPWRTKIRITVCHA